MFGHFGFSNGGFKTQKNVSTSVKRGLLAFGVFVCGATSIAGPSGTSVWGEEAREVYNTLSAAGATRTEIPEGPTIIIDRLECWQRDVNGQLTAKCQVVGDPKLKAVDGAIGLRMVKALMGIGVNQKKLDPQTVTVGVRSMECGILHNVPTVGSEILEGEPSKTQEEASCFFIDLN